MEDNRLNFSHPLPFYKSELKSGPVCSPGTVPFLWETSPGMPKTSAPVDSRDSSFDDCITEEATTASTFFEDEGVYSDAPEELSRTESFFFNCSIGGISGLEEGAEVIPFGTLSSDPMFQDLMMGRFLPAAQAMAAEAPTHASHRKRMVKVEEARCVSRERKEPQQLRYWECRPDLSPNYAPELYGFESGDEDEDEDGNGDCSLSDDRRMRGCWFLPRFCAKVPFRIMSGMTPSNLKTEDSVEKCHTVSSNKLFNPWSEQKYVGQARTWNPKIYSLGQSRSKGSVTPKPGNSPLHRKIQAHSYGPRFSHDGGRANMSELDTKRKNDSLPREKPSTSFRDLLAREKDEWDLRPKLPSVEKNTFAGCGRKDESGADASKPKTDRRDTAVVHSESSSIRKTDNVNRQQEKVDSDMASHCTNMTPERGGDAATRTLRKANHDNQRAHYTNIPLSPPLPNSPTESWLVRTLPFAPSPKQVASPRRARKLLPPST